MKPEHLQKIKDIFGVLQEDTVKPKDLQDFLTAITKVLKDQKDRFENQANVTLTEAKSMLQTFSKTDENKFKQMIKEIEKLIDKVNAIEVKDGQDADEEIIVEKVLERIPKLEIKEETRKDIVNKINTGKKDDTKIDSQQITGLDKIGKDIENRALSILDQRTQYLINKGVKHDSTLSGSGTDADPLSVIGGGGGGSPGGSDTQLQYNNAGSFGGMTGSVVSGNSLGLGGTPDASAILDMQSTTQGFLPPRMTITQRDAIVSPATYLTIYNTDTSTYQYHFGSGTWVNLLDTANIYGEGNIPYVDNAGILRVNANSNAGVFQIEPTANGFGQLTNGLIMENIPLNLIFDSGHGIPAGANAFAITSEGSNIFKIDSNGYVTVGTFTANKLLYANSDKQMDMIANSSYYGDSGNSALTLGGDNSGITGVDGANLNLDGGNATVGDANGGYVNITAGTGVGTGLDGIINITGLTKLSSYGSGTNTGTATYNLSVDSSGNIIETATGGGGGLTVGTTAIASGTAGRILFEGAGNVLQESSNLVWDNTNIAMELGATTISSGLGYVSYMGGKNVNSYYVGAYYQNLNAGADADAEINIGADNDTVGGVGRYLAMGINSSGYASATYDGLPADAFLYNSAGNFQIFTGTATKVIQLYTGGYLAANKRVVIGAGTAASPSLAIVTNGTADMGFYSSATNTLGISIAGTARYNMNGTRIVSGTAGGFYIGRAAGTAAAPTFTFNGTIDTGMWLNGTALGFSVGGTNRVTIDTTGITSGAWLGTVISPVYGGTGVANGSNNTITFAGGNFGLTLTQSGTTSLVLPNSGTVATLAGTEALTNKTLGVTNTITASDDLFSLVDGTDNTKKVIFELSSITTATTRTLQFPNVTTTLVGRAGNQTFTGVNTFNGNVVIAGAGGSPFFQVSPSSLTTYTRGGAGVNPRIVLALSSGTTSNSNSAIVLDQNTMYFVSGTTGGTPTQAARASFSLNNAVNTTGSEESDLLISTTSAGAAPSQKMRISGKGNIVAGAESALATNATDGFLYVPACAGTPTGAPTAYTGKIAVVADSTNNKLYIYSGGAWVALN